MLRRVLGVAVAAAIVCGAPATAQAGLVKDVLKATQLTKPSATLTPTCTTASGRTTCTGPVPLLTCTKVAASPYNAAGQSCLLGFAPYSDYDVGLVCRESLDGSSAGCSVGQLGCASGDQGSGATAKSRTVCSFTPLGSGFDCTTGSGAPPNDPAKCPLPLDLAGKLVTALTGRGL